MKKQRNTLKYMRRTRRYLSSCVLCSILVIFSCQSGDHQVAFFEIGSNINSDFLNVTDMYTADSIIIKTATHIKRTNIQIHTFSEENILYFYRIDSISSKLAQTYIEFLSEKIGRYFKIDSSIVAVDFMCTSYTWKDSISKDFYELYSCIHVGHNTTSIGDLWTLEVGNDSLISYIRSLDIDY
jgi:hypothetical protein